MTFCEDCRLKRQWPRAPGFPFIGVESGVFCEVCHKINDCHTVPSLILTPESKRTFEQKQIYKIMQEGFKDRAETLVVSKAGKIDHGRTELLRSILIRRDGEVDWYSTYQLRLVAQQGYQKDEESKRDRRAYGL